MYTYLQQTVNRITASKLQIENTGKRIKLGINETGIMETANRINQLTYTLYRC